MPDPSESDGVKPMRSSSQMPLDGLAAIVRGLPRSTWLILAGAALAVVVVIAAVAGLWGGVGNNQISAAGWAAMILGVLLTLALGIGLMSLVFYSDRHGYDDNEPRG
jgi:hypothetical protein